MKTALDYEDPTPPPPDRNDFARGLIAGLILGGFIAACIVLVALKAPYAA
jgi:hypothetical protein